jgi:serine/threonine protein kinase
MLGRTIGKYRILSPLGRGATGTVYKALDESLGREVAIKVLRPDLADSTIMRRFRAEATTLAKLNHPHIATVYELVRAEADLLMVMEFVRGETVEQLSDRVGAMRPDHAACIIDKVLSALEHAHNAGVVHRDMKPANVMVTDTGVVKIMDFGIARVRGGERMTIDGGMMGTPAYISPEQVLGHDVDARADLYSVGVVLYRLLTGAVPFSGDAIAVLQKQVTQPPPPLHLKRDGLPGWCQTIVERATEKSPGDRFQSAREFRDALARAAGLSTDIDLAAAFPITASDPARPTAERADQGGSETVVLSIVDAIPRDDSRVRTFPFGSTGSRVAIAAGIAAVFVLGLLLRPAVRLLTTRANRFPVVVFETKALVGSGSRQREIDGRLALADGKVMIRANGDSERPIYEVPYGDVISISYSHGRDPIWNSPDGPAVVVRSHGGTLAMLGVSVQRDWVSLETTTETATAGRFLVLQFDDQLVGPVLAALEERTGRSPQVVHR